MSRTPGFDVVVLTGKFLPAVHRELHRVNVLGGVVAIELSVRGIFLGPFETPAGVIQPTGAKLDIPTADFRYVRDGKIQEFSCRIGAAATFAQLGVLPDFTSAVAASAPHDNADESGGKSMTATNAPAAQACSTGSGTSTSTGSATVRCSSPARRLRAAARPRGRDRAAPYRCRAGRQPHRHGRRLRPVHHQRDHPGGALPVLTVADRDQSRDYPRHSRVAGCPATHLSRCASRRTTTSAGWARRARRGLPPDPTGIDEHATGPTRSPPSSRHSPNCSSRA